MKKLFALILALSMLLTMAVASGEGEKTTVVFWNSWTGGDGDALQALVTKFNESQNEVFVDMTRTTSFGDMLQTSLPTKEAADLILLNCNDLNKYGSYLLPLNDIWENEYFRMEFSAEKSWHSGLELYLKATNLLNLPLIRYIMKGPHTEAVSDFPRYRGNIYERKERYGQTLMIGVRYKL